MKSGKDTLMELRRDEARYAAKKLLATQSCTEDALTAAIFDFAKENIEWIAQQVIEATAASVDELDKALCEKCRALVGMGEPEHEDAVNESKHEDFNLDDGCNPPAAGQPWCVRCHSPAVMFVGKKTLRCEDCGHQVQIVA